jgi:oligopeptide/dipeptide ABC transporter ATP-binding protein
MEKKLQVKDLTVSFRTSNGKVQAVRGINFELNKGETLAIVGESGSGKSVTSKAILGILAGNSIVEGGEIIYDGKDLLKIYEEDFHKIRGDKIAMIFQDPMSSLNPIVKIGRQLTEAMILKGKSRQRESRKLFNTTLQLLRENMGVANKVDNAAEIAKEKCEKFDKFEYKHLELESAYNDAVENASDALYALDDLILEVSKKAAKDLSYRVKQVAKRAVGAIHEYLVSEDSERLKALAEKIVALVPETKRGSDPTPMVSALSEIREILKKAEQLVAPNFFAMGYYLTYSAAPLPNLPVNELNDFMRKYLDDNFMLDFIRDTKIALEHSADISYKEKEEALSVLRANRGIYAGETFDKSACYDTLKVLSKEVAESIDRLEIVKDSLAYTFASGLKSELDRYFRSIQKNESEMKRYTKQQAKYDALVARGKEPESSVIPPSITDINMVRKNILSQIDRLIEHYETFIAKRDERDFDKEAVAMIDFLKLQASGVVHKVTKASARRRALKLMSEVGIPDARIRYNQYPFEFSGGMRQRIVIAIALAADPDILICDEPTTALDVTIQAQILELINNLKKERNLSVIFITHDLGVVANMADRIAVMYAGKIVECGTAEDIFYDPRHPYTWALLSSMPDLDTNEKLDAIPGTPPNMIFPPKGDAFAARNKYAMKIDFEQQPPMFKVSETHMAATWLLHPDAPKVEMPEIISERIARMKQRRDS